MFKWKNLVYLLIIAVFLIPQISFAGFSFSTGSGGTSFSFSTGSGSGSGSGWNLYDLSGFGLPSGSISGIIANILSWLLAIFGFLGIIGFVISGIMYVLASGNEGMIDKAKSAMTWSIVGVVVGLVGFVVIQAINTALNGYGSF